MGVPKSSYVDKTMSTNCGCKFGRPYTKQECSGGPCNFKCLNVVHHFRETPPGDACDSYGDSGPTLAQKLQNCGTAAGHKPNVANLDCATKDPAAKQKVDDLNKIDPNCCRYAF
jgi:hypothetical protein